ncbi:MAG: hypothetical protein U9R75_04605 [Candidatus Thermoplasmatota archaeon]|nr:hypothetical protein [Candidatus Thermoplasmatota archaeon]
MQRRIVPGNSDKWGKRPRDPLLRMIYDDPKKAARLQALISVGLIVFWISVVIGLLIITYFLIFG